MSWRPAASCTVLLTVLTFAGCGSGASPNSRVGGESGASSTTSGSTFSTTGVSGGTSTGAASGGATSGSACLIFPRSHGQCDYAANWFMRVFNSNSIGLT